MLSAFGGAAVKRLDRPSRVRVCSRDVAFAIALAYPIRVLGGAFVSQRITELLQLWDQVSDDSRFARAVADEQLECHESPGKEQTSPAAGPNEIVSANRIVGGAGMQTRPE